MKQYLELLNRVLTEGTPKNDRTGVGTRSIFGCQMRFDLQLGFPLLTTKAVHFKSVAHELLWFLKGETNIQYLKDNGVRIWNEWADEKGNLGPVYGKQWRSWPTESGDCVDQISQVLHQIKTTPDSRRMIVSAWNVGQLDQMALPPCHAFFQFYVANNRLSCMLTQRSADIFLGVPFNIASYALLTHMMAKDAELDVGEFVFSAGDCHLYDNHVEQAKLQLTRQPGVLPRIFLNEKVNSIFDYKFDDIELINYSPAPKIKAKVAV